MVAPQISLRVTDLTLYAPRTTNATMGCVGPASKGPVNRLTDFTDPGNFVGTHGRPLDRGYAQRGFNRYLARGDQGKFVRVAGANLATATAVVYAADGVTPILNFTAFSPGSWANDNGLSVSITLNGTASYNVQVFENGQPTSDLFVGLSNGVVESRVNNGSKRVQVRLARGAGNTFPAATVNTVTGALQPKRFTGGDDGAFAKSDSTKSSTSGVAGRRFFGKMDATAGSRTWVKLLDIDAALAGLTRARGTLGMPVVPGTVTIRAQTGSSTWAEVSDDGDLSYGPGGAGVGLLLGSGSRKGYIDYRTGDFAIDITGSTLFSSGEIQGQWVRAIGESVGTAAKGLGEYAGNLSHFSLAPGHFNSNRAAIYVPVDEVAGTVALGDSGAGSADATLKTLAGWVVPGTIVLTPTHDTDAVPPPIYDDGLGGFRTAPNGGGVAVPGGTINYRTGAWDVTTWDPVGGVTFPSVTAASVQATYDILLIDMGGGAVPGNANGFESETPQLSVPIPAAPGAPSLATAAGGSVDVGSHDYAVVFVTAAGRSDVGTTATVVVAGSHTVNLTSIPTGPAGTTARIIVRTKAAAPGVYFTVTTINDNVTTTYSDTAADAGLTAFTTAGGMTTIASTDTGAQRLPVPIKPGTVVLSISDVSGSPVSFYDDGVGGWLTRPRGDPRAAAAAGGSIDYDTGAWDITVTTAYSIAETAVVTVTYTSTPEENGRRHLRGTGPQFVANTAANAAGMDLTSPAAGDDYNGPNWLDHATGEFAFKLDLVTSGARTFDLKDNGVMTAVYLPADILGYGDGSETTFTGTLSKAPYRRQNNRAMAFQGSEAATAGSGHAQVAFAKLGTTADADYWNENVAASTDPDNFLDLRTGETSIQWTSAPLRDEAVFVAADDIVMHVTSRYPGDIGNERTTLTDGLWVEVTEDATLAGTLVCNVYFGATDIIESFGQAPTIDDLVSAINDSANGSDFIRAVAEDAAGILDVDTTASQSVGMSGAFTRADVIGSKVGSVTTGLQMFRNPDIVPLDWIMVPGQWHASVITALQSLVERRGRRAIGILPTPDTDDVFQLRDFANGEWNSGPGLPPVPTARVPFPPAVAVDSRQIGVFGPYLTYFDDLSNAEVTEPPDGDIAALVANCDSVAAPWFPIAGGKRGRVLADAVKYSVELDDQNLVYGLVGSRTEIINVIAAYSGRGLQLNGQRTAQREATSLDRINVSWTVNVIMNKLDAGAKDFQFELNDTILWRSIKAFVESVLGPIKERRGLQDYFVIVDDTTTTADDIDNLRVHVKVFIKPARATEYLDFDVILTPTGADFADVAAAA